METCGYNGFCLMDLHHPEPQRLRSQLSAAINMAEYLEGPIKIYEELEQRVRVSILENIRSDYKDGSNYACFRSRVDL